MENKENKNRTSFRIEPELHKILVETVQKLRFTPRKTSMDAVITAGIRWWLENEGAQITEQRRPDAVSKDEQRWIDMLLKVLRSGDKHSINAVQSNLILFARHIDLLKQQKSTSGIEQK